LQGQLIGIAMTLYAKNGFELLQIKIYVYLIFNIYL